MRILFSFISGALVGAAAGTLVGLITADPDDPRQQAIREAARRVYEEARRAAEEQERSLREEYERLTGLAERTPSTSDSAGRSE